jgi:hypothetical protein
MQQDLARTHFPAATVVAALALVLISADSVLAQSQDACFVGRCVPAGQDVCTICPGKIMQVETYTSVSGTCTGTIFGLEALSCNGGAAFANDILILEVTPVSPLIFEDSFESDSAVAAERSPPR